MRFLNVEPNSASLSTPSSGGGAASQESSERRAEEPGGRLPGGAPSAPTPQDVLESLAGGVVALDSAARITYVNRMAERMLGRARADLLGQDVRAAFPRTLGASLFTAYQQARQGRAAVMSAAFYRPRRLWLEAGVSPAPSGAVVALADVTERARLEKQGKRAAQRAPSPPEEAPEPALREGPRLRQLMNSALVGMFISAGGRIIEANDAFLTLLGYTRQDVTSGALLWPALTPAEFAERDRIALGQIMTEGECAPYQKELYRRDGSRIAVLVDGARLEPGGTELAGFVLDLTGHNLRERALAERAGELDATIEAIADGVLLYDAQGGLTRLNHAACAILGVASVEDYKCLPLSERVHLFNIRRMDGQPIPPDDTLIQQGLQHFMQGSEAPLDLSLRTLDGRDIALSVIAAPVYSASGARVGSVVIGRDTTARVRLERSLMEANNRLVEVSNEAERRAQQWLTVIDTIADGVVILDREGRITQVNQTMRAMLGISHQPVEAFAARPFEEWRERYDMRDSAGEPFASEAWPIARVLAGERLVAGAAIDMLVRAPDGTDVTISVSGAPIRDERGEISSAVFVIRDITERTAHEREQAETLDNVAHELNSPLTTLSLLVRIFTREARLPSSQLKGLIGSINRLTRLSEELRAARGLAGNGVFPLDRERTDLCALCASAAAEQMAQVEHEVIVLLPDHPVYANVDPVRVGQALTNLISNAVKYGPADQPVTVRLLEGDGFARIETHDEGPGIPPDVQRRLFERFYRAPSVKRHYSGIGLGLYISQRLIELHGGRMGVVSEPGQGTTFWLTVPLEAG
ncbi:MAG TPA: PAS domain S-box protein [Ktedonobacterales bacterium]|nr:PAS domain S-box protein [Ktedonobacterales bacterium]